MFAHDTQQRGWDDHFFMVDAKSFCSFVRGFFNASTCPIFLFIKAPDQCLEETADQLRGLCFSGRGSQG